DGTVNVMEAARSAGTRAFVYTSSCCAVMDNMRDSYPNIDEDWVTSPVRSTIYGESKALAEIKVLGANDKDSK
ncbi:NAD-dependent epimerase/dehydratase family protein, partial [Barnesiella sp. GGCC_0306]|nr:NAD-dependent epimerase/dehydratase family protein [Barnesiella sp. GGCC_0306]